MLQGDIIEDPDYLEKNKDILPDYLYYFEHQIKKPVEQIFSLYRDDANEMVKDIILEYKNKKSNDTDITIFLKKKQ